MLVVVALTALDGAFDGPGYLAAGLLAALVVVGSVAAGRALRRPLVAVPVAFVALALGLPFVALRGTPSGPWPTPATWGRLADAVVHGWRDLLTTLPPVPADGRLVVVPAVVAAAATAVGLTLARTRSRFAPVAGPALALAAAALLGTPTPGAVAARGIALALGAVVWAAARDARSRVVAGAGTSRALTGAALLAAAAAVTALAAPLAVPDAARTVVRDGVGAPVTVADATSPLAGFRRLTPGQRLLADTPLLRVDGLPTGTPVRLAVLDTYSGTVWSSGAAQGRGDFLRVGSRVAAPMPGRAVAGHVTVEPGLLAAPGLRSYLPTAGQLTSVRFTGADGVDRDDDVRVDPTSGAAVVLGGLRTGDRYAVTGVVPDGGVPTSVGAVPQPSVAGADAAVTTRLVAAAVSGGSDRLAQVRAVADRLRRTGAYTDGVGADARYPAGHGIGRMTAFLDGPQPVGDDEQYASALALASAQIGLPSRVVLVGTPTGGVVRGRDVRAAVEVATGPGTWWTLPASTFVPDRSRRPTPRTDQRRDTTERAVVPPPNAQRPPSSTDQQVIDSSSSATGRSGVAAAVDGLPLWARIVLGVVLVPLLAVAAWVGLVAAARAVRRARRRRAAPPVAVDGAWRELVDDLRDHRVSVPRGATRAQVAAATGMPGVVLLAGQVDSLSFGRTAPDADDVARVWERLQVVRAGLRVGRGPRERLRAALSVRSLLPDRAPVDDGVRPSARYRALVDDRGRRLVPVRVPRRR